MTYNMSIFAKQKSVGRASDGTWAALRGTRDGALINMPWYQALVLEGKVFGINAGTVSTPIAGHAAIDADQPEAAVYFSAGVAVIPLSVRAAQETGATTLATGGLMTAVSNISVGAGTSTAATPFNLNLFTPNATQVSAAHTYSGNGTDPLTAGNFLELARATSLIDADAATSGIIPPVLNWSVYDGIAPVLVDAGSFLLYGEAAANTLFGTLIWGELSESDVE